MRYQVTRLEFFGQPNRRVWLSAELDDPIQRLIRSLKPARHPRVRSLSCWPNRSNRALFLYQLPDGTLMYVLGDSVELPDGPRIDQSRNLETWALEAMESGEPVRAAACRRCAPREPSGQPLRCPCDSPIDLSEWNVAAVINHNNCYSFARRARWCAGGQGSQPGDQLSSNETQIREGLFRDGLVRVTEQDVLTGTGDFVALLLEGIHNYHFLRLDGDRWTHMPANHAAIACDADGNPILKNRLRQANMQGLRFLDYFRVPPNTPLTHCF